MPKNLFFQQKTKFWHRIPSLQSFRNFCLTPNSNKITFFIKNPKKPIPHLLIFPITDSYLPNLSNTRHKLCFLFKTLIKYMKMDNPENFLYWILERRISKRNVTRLLRSFARNYGEFSMLLVFNKQIPEWDSSAKNKLGNEIYLSEERCLIVSDSQPASVIWFQAIFH